LQVFTLKKKVIPGLANINPASQAWLPPERRFMWRKNTCFAVVVSLAHEYTFR